MAKIKMSGGKAHKSLHDADFQAVLMANAVRFMEATTRVAEDGLRTLDDPEDLVMFMVRLIDVVYAPRVKNGVLLEDALDLVLKRLFREESDMNLRVPVTLALVRYNEAVRVQSYANRIRKKGPNAHARLRSVLHGATDPTIPLARVLTVLKRMDATDT